VRVGGLFSGLGGLELGLQQAGMQVLWHCEQDGFCRSVLEQHWPGLPCYPDVRTLTGPEPVDILAGGFPCQDVSHVGRRAGLGGQHSGLWTHFARLVGELRPRYVLVENVAGLLVRGMGEVLADLAALRYDCEWEVLPAAAFGAPHLRARVWLLAYPSGGRQRSPDDTVFAGRYSAELGRRWANEPDVARVAHGISGGVERRRALGNSLVVPIARWIGECVQACNE
jgi:DNA (cytosine-5)-methyltransferase 1